jgi:hypothetical protein
MSISPPSAPLESPCTDDGTADAIQKRLAALPKRLLAGVLARACRRARALFDLPQDDLVRRLCLDTMDAVIRQAENVATGKKALYVGPLTALCRAAGDVVDEASGSSGRGSRIVELARELVELLREEIKGQGDLESSVERIARLLADMDEGLPSPHVIDGLLADVGVLQRVGTGAVETIDVSPSGPLGPLWPVPAPNSPLEQAAFDGVADEWRWIHEQRSTGKFDDYIGKHVAVYQHQILGATRDVDLLREVLVERYQIAPERIVFVYID